MRSTPAIGLSEFAGTPAPGRARRPSLGCFASSKHTGDAASPIASFGGRANTIGTSVLYRS